MDKTSTVDSKAAEAAQDALPPQQDDSLPSYTQAASIPQQIPDPARNNSLPDYSQAVLNSPPTQHSPTAIETAHTTTNNTTLPRNDPDNETLPDYAAASTDPPPRIPRTRRSQPSEPQERSEAYMEALRSWAAERDMMRPRAYGEYFAKTHNLPEDEAHAVKKSPGSPGRMSSFMKKLKGKGKDDDAAATHEEAEARAGPSTPGQGPREGDAVLGRGGDNEDLGNNYW
ncbi:hypothetical protein MBLNU457_g2557t1 [Dothideomycetes sp. NU457]